MLPKVGDADEKYGHVVAIAHDGVLRPGQVEHRALELGHHGCEHEHVDDHADQLLQRGQRVRPGRAGQHRAEPAGGLRHIRGRDGKGGENTGW
eukprot:1909944-Pyramimonas_sp.AAC.1